MRGLIPTNILRLVLTSDLNKQINEVSLKANRKLAVLRSVKLLNRQTLDLLYKLTVRSVIDYGLLVYYKALKLTDLARLDNIQYKAAKLVTGAFHLTNKEKSNKELGCETISERGDILSLSFFHKIHLGETRPLLKTCLLKVNLINSLSTRSNIGYIQEKFKGEVFETYFFCQNQTKNKTTKVQTFLKRPKNWKLSSDKSLSW